LKVNGQPLDEARKYTLTAPTFIAIDGGDGYEMLKGSTVVLPPERAPLDSEALQRTISAVRAIAPKVEGRIKRLDTVKKADPGCK
jgi:2',3'-cyclic-nucleotide 2'-phosphodiesterase (5'-nucleotidase family)